MQNKTEISEKHLEFIQNVITRMGQNSFQAKAWCITVISALLVLVINKNCQNWTPYAISISVTILFCSLDTYYLYLEKGYRALYNICAGIEKTGVIKKYDMIIPKEYRGIRRYFIALRSVSTGLFYLVIIIGEICLYLFN